MQKQNAIVFASRIVQSVVFINPKFLASSLCLTLYRQICVRSGWEPRRLVFSHCCSNYPFTLQITCPGNDSIILPKFSSIRDVMCHHTATVHADSATGYTSSIFIITKKKEAYTMNSSVFSSPEPKAHKVSL